MNEVIIVTLILLVAIVLFITEWVRVDLVALMVMLGLAVCGILTAEEAIQGFSNEAVITIASVLVLSGGLIHTGVANLIGARVLAAAGNGMRKLIAVMMATVGLLSGIMNDIGIAALMLPVVLEMARKLKIPPSKLLMPLAFGSLLGGMTTLIGTAPNILVNGAIADAGLEPFGMFSFTPVGLTALIVGVLYMTFIGRRFLPTRDPKEETASADLDALYELGSAMATLTIPEGSALKGKTLASSRMGRALGLNVLAIQRGGQATILGPSSDTTLQEDDELIAEGDLERLAALRAWQHLEIESREKTFERMEAAPMGFVELEVAESSLAERTIRKAKLWEKYRLHVLAIRRNGEVSQANLRRIVLKTGDRLVAAADREHLRKLKSGEEFKAIRPLPVKDTNAEYHLDRRLQSVRVPQESLLAGQLLKDTHLTTSFGLVVMGVLRDKETHLAPGPDEKLESGDVLLIRGLPEDLKILEALQDLELNDHQPPEVSAMESDTVGFVEASLSSRTTFAGRTVDDLNFREKYGVSILAIWRNGKIYRNRIREMELLPGDAFLLYGNREKLAFLAGHPDFLVLTNGNEIVRKRKAPVSSLIMAGVLVSVISGALPIFIAAPIGALLMVLTRCLKVEEAYRSIELKAIVLIAGMLSLGLAMQESGTAELVPKTVLGSIAGFGPLAVVAGLFLITAISAQVMPTAAVAVLMSPIALSTAASEGLSPHALMMTVALASSCAFMSPVGHPVNLLVMGFGGYRFLDFAKVGFPLIILMLLVVLIVLPLVWPLVPAP